MIEEIRRIFLDTKSPSGDVSSETYDDEGAKFHFNGTHWTEHSSEEIISKNLDFCLNFFTPAAFAHFLPAYLIAAIENPDSGAAENIINRLIPPKNDPSRPSYAAWWQMLNESQKVMVIKFLRHFQQTEFTEIESSINSLENSLPRPNPSINRDG